MIRSLDLDVAGGDPATSSLNTFGSVVSFGQDGLGCSYVMTYDEVFRLDGETAEATACRIRIEPPVEVTYDSYIPKRAVIRGFLGVGAKCSISCAATATATFRISRNRFRRKPVKFRPAPARAKLGPNVRYQLQVQIPARRVKAVRKAIRNGSRVTAFVKVTAAGADGSRGTGSGTVRLVRPKRR